MLKKLRLSSTRDNNDDSQFSDDDILISPPVPWRDWAISFFLVMAYLPVAWAAGLCHFTFLASSSHGWEKTLLSLVLSFFFYWGAIHAVLALPISLMALPQIDKWKLKFWRVVTFSALTTAPIVAFGFYRGGFKEIMDFNEVMLVAIPGCVLASLVYDRCRIPRAFSFLLAISTFFSFFLLNDVLGTLPTVGQYMAEGASFYVLRQLFPVLGLFCGFFLLGPESAPHRNHSKENFFWGVVSFLVYVIITHYLIPVADSLLEKGDGPIHIVHEWGWLLAVAACGLLYLKRSWTDKALAVVSVSYIGVLVYQMIVSSRVEGSDYWKLGDLEYSLMGILLFGWILISLRPIQATKS